MVRLGAGPDAFPERRLPSCRQWIRQAITRSATRTIRVPVHMVEAINNIARAGGFSVKLKHGPHPP